MEDEIKACPFCFAEGAVGTVEVPHWEIDAVSEEWLVSCASETCDVGPMTHSFADRAAAIRAWNTRAPAKEPTDA